MNNDKYVKLCPGVQDNYAETSKLIGQYVLSNAPDGMCESDKRDLVDPPTHFGNRIYFSMRFERNDRKSGCQLYVGYQHIKPELEDKSMADNDSIWSKYVIDYVDDQDNIWAKYGIEVTMTWPSWGSDPLPLVKQRLDLFNEVYAFAHQLQNLFSYPIWKLEVTRDEREKNAIIAEKNRIHARVNEIVRNAPERKGMAVLKQRTLSSLADKVPGTNLVYNLDIPPGEYEVKYSFQGKEFLYKLLYFREPVLIRLA